MPLLNFDPGTYNFRIYKGANFERTFTWKDSNGNPVDLTNYSAQMIFRHQGQIVLTLSSPTNITLGGVNGTILVEMNSTETGALTFTRASYSLAMTNPDNDVAVLLVGRVTTYVV